MKMKILANDYIVISDDAFPPTLSLLRAYINCADGNGLAM